MENNLMTKMWLSAMHLFCLSNENKHPDLSSCMLSSYLKLLPYYAFTKTCNKWSSEWVINCIELALIMPPKKLKMC